MDIPPCLASAMTAMWNNDVPGAPIYKQDDIKHKCPNAYKHAQNSFGLNHRFDPEPKFYPEPVYFVPSFRNIKPYE